jgi:DNA-binding GntR family transcriptional regulator
MEYIKIDKTLAIPLHIQLARSIRDAIDDNTLPAQSKLPTEEELGLHFNLSRPVVRQAYKQLIEERLIYRQKSKGSFVLAKEERFNLLKVVLPLTEKIGLTELSENVVELEHTIIPYNTKTMSILELNKGDKVHFTKRIYYGERHTMFYIEIIQPMVEYINSPKDMNRKENIEQTHRNIFAIKLDKEMCKLFNAPENSAGFKITSTTLSKSKKVIEMSTAYVQGYNISIILDYFKQ